MMEEASKGRAAGRVPVALLEEAFQGVDVQLRNRITIRELLAVPLAAFRGLYKLYTGCSRPVFEQNEM